MRKYLARHLRRPMVWQIALACYWLTLFVLTHIPINRVLSPVMKHDKTVHFVAYTILAAVLATTWQLSAGRLTVPQLGWAWVVVTLFAALDEWTQSFVGREASIGDWFADAAGAAAALMLFAWFRKRLP